ncbi:hypothetical protein BD779DRAFT_290203 [Infundibulicybe gibba]|nr:hypothetical protein BD779DRAFT_290203 [Infundibulicybe gibba]
MVFMDPVFTNVNPRNTTQPRSQITPPFRKTYQHYECRAGVQTFMLHYMCPCGMQCRRSDPISLFLWSNCGRITKGNIAERALRKGASAKTALLATIILGQPLPRFHPPLFILYRFIYGHPPRGPANTGVQTCVISIIWLRWGVKNDSKKKKKKLRITVP